MREPGLTFAPDQIGWLDWESKQGAIPLGDGVFRYMKTASPLVLAVAIGDSPAIALPWPVAWRDLPRPVRDHQKRVERGEAVWAAWNAVFDREVWNQLTNYPRLEVEHIIDVMAQAMAAGLPGKLDFAAKLAGTTRKIQQGKELIKLFSIEHAQPEDYPMEWATFLEYAANDIEAMRELFDCTLQLPIEDWREYWVSERINLRGIGFDVKLAKQADAMAHVAKEPAAKELDVLTKGAVTAVTQPMRMVNWLTNVLDARGRSLLTRRVEERDEDTGEILKPAKYTLRRNRLQLLIAALADKPERTPIEEKALRLLEIRQYGGSSTPAKFDRMLATGINGTLYGQFRCNGAEQTGRFSSQGVQVHRLMLDALDYEMDGIDALAVGCDHDKLAKLGDDKPVVRKLSMLIRPTLVPGACNAFVWGDFAQIEARILAWLADSPGGEARLDIFREVDQDPSKPDLYTRTASALSDLPIEEIDKPTRQRGKVAELALGFAGGVGALLAMAAGYGLTLSDDLARATVQAWRNNNQWAVRLWHDLWHGFRAAMANPLVPVPVGRISYTFLPAYLGGSVICRLPSGRVLTYRRLKGER